MKINQEEHQRRMRVAALWSAICLLIITALLFKIAISI